MKRINLVKYGFERCPEQDFSDDGNRFQVYRVGTLVIVSKHVYNGDAYISARIDGTKLPFEVYSKLPHYRSLDALNGVSISALTEDDLICLHENCLCYEEEYRLAEQGIKMPTLDEIKEQCVKIQQKRKAEAATIARIMSATLPMLLETLSDYKWSTVKKYYTRLLEEAERFDPEVYAKKVFNQSISIALCKDNQYLGDSFYFKELVNILS